MHHSVSFYLKPAPGVRLPDPVTGDYLPEAGRRVPRSGYWLRRVKDGDAVEVAEAAQAVQAAQAAQAAPVSSAKPKVKEKE